MPPITNLYVNPNSQVYNYVRGLGAGLEKTRLTWVANVPQAFWSGIEWDPSATGIKSYLDGAAAAGKIGQVVLYSIPLRDLGSYSGGGANSIAGYNTWVDYVTAAVGTRAVIVVVEPDAMAQSDGLTAQQQTDRFTMLSRTLQQFKQKCPSAKVYIDVGNANWRSPSDVVGQLNRVGVDNCAGFSMNVSNYRTATENQTYGANIRNLLGKPNVHYVYDSGRGGNPNIGYDFANQGNRTFGQQPQYLNTNVDGCDGWFWFKGPGESDANNGSGAPNAGTLWPLYLFNPNVGDNVSSTDYSVQAVPVTSGMAQREPVISATSGGGGGGGIPPPPVGDTWTPVGASNLTLSPWYPNGAKPNMSLAQLRQYARKRYDQFMNFCLTQEGMPNGMPAGAYRIKVPDQGFYLNPHVDGTVSEGIGYGMLVSAWFSNANLPEGIYDPYAQAHFDGLLKYYKYYENSHGLMNWNITYQGQVADYNGATDGDLDAAMAILIMHRIHGSTDGAHPNYAAEATTLITAIRDWEFVPATGVPGAGTYANYMTNGDGWGFQTDHYMPDYFRAGHIREFYNHTGDNRWLDILTLNYQKAVDYWNTNFQGGTVPDASNRALTAVQGYNYETGYNSIRAAIGIAMDYVWHGTKAGANAKPFMSKLVSKSITRYGTGNQVKAIPWDLNHNGDAGYYNSATAQMVGTAALVDSQFSQFAAELMTAMYADNQNSYFGNGLAAVGAMLMAGIAQPGSTDGTYAPQPTQTVTSYVRHWHSEGDSTLDFNTITQNDNTVAIPDAGSGKGGGNAIKIVSSATSNEGTAFINLSNSPVRIVQFDINIPTACTFTTADYTVFHSWTPVYAANLFEIRLIASGAGYKVELVEPDNSYFTTVGTNVLSKNVYHTVRLEIEDAQARVYVDGNLEITRNAPAATTFGVIGPMSFGKFYSTALSGTWYLDNLEAGAIEAHQEVITGGGSKTQTGKANIRRSNARTQSGVGRISNNVGSTSVRVDQYGRANIKAYAPPNSVRRTQIGKFTIQPSNAYLESLIRRNYFPYPSFEVLPPATMTYNNPGVANDGPALFGSKALKFYSPGNGSATDSGYIIPLGQFNQGDVVTISAYGRTLQYDANPMNATITTRGSLPTVTLKWDQGNQGAYTRKSMTLTVGGTGNAEIVIGLGAYGGQSRGEFYVDGLLIEKAPAAGLYFDGDTPNGAWTSTPHQSQSILYPNLQPKIQYGIANLVNKRMFPQTGVANIRNNTQRAITGRTAMRIGGVKLMLGKARLQRNYNTFLLGKSRITAKAPRTISGKATIVNRVQRTINGRGFIVARPYFGDKRFEYKVFSKDGSYLGNITRLVTSDFELPQEINTPGSVTTIHLGTPADDFNEGNMIKFGNRVEVYVYDADLPNGQLYFQGAMENYKPTFGSEGVDVELQGFGNRFSTYIMTTNDTTPKTFVSFQSVDPSAIFKAAIDKAAAKGSPITYTSGSIDLTGTSVSYDFNTATILDVIDKALELCPVGWYYYIDQATNVFHLHQRVNTPNHTFLLDKDIMSLAVDKRTQDIRNVVYFTGGKIGVDTTDPNNPKDINLFRVYENAGSIAAYGRREDKKSDTRVKVTATADTMAHNILDIHAGPELLVDMEVMDNAVTKRLGYDLETIKMGQMVKIGALDNNSANASLWDAMVWDSNKWDYDVTDISTLVLQVTKMKYNGNKVTLNLSTTPPDINKRIQDQERNLDALETSNNPVTATVGT